MTTTITAAVSRGTDSPFTIEELDLDDPRPDEVVVRIGATGVCHSDIAALDHPMLEWPAVLGHEGAGVVERVGDHVTDVKVGDHVATSFVWCGRCAACLQGRPTRCASMRELNFSGVRADGSHLLHTEDGAPVSGRFMGQSAFANHVLVPASSVIVVPDDLDPVIVAGLGCALQTGAGSILNALRVTAGDHVVISGAGSVGLAAVMAARAAGATRIVAVDLLPSRRALATRVGATHTVDGAREDLAAAIHEALGGSADAAFDASGAPDAVLADVTVLKADGRIALAAGGFSKAAQSPVATGKSVVNVLVGDQMPHVFIPRLIDLYRSGLIDLDAVITRYPLADIDRALADTRAGTTAKAILIP